MLETSILDKTGYRDLDSWPVSVKNFGRITG